MIVHGDLKHVTATEILATFGDSFERLNFIKCAY